MTERITLQDDLRAMGWPGEQKKVSPCCSKLMASFNLVRLTPEEAARLGVAYACAGCLAGPPPQGVVIVDLADAWGDNEAANGVRADRVLRLTACDWTQVPDAPMPEEVRTAWRAYRQALRDLTETFASPLDVTWPSPPGA